MSNIWEEFKKNLTEIAGSWSSYIAIGTFIVYLLGYLVVRFHLTVWGIGTDLSVLDERYLFAGAKFLVYLFSTIPIIVLIAFAFSILTLIFSILVILLLRLINRALPPKRRISTISFGRLWRSHLCLWSHPQKVLGKLQSRTNALIGILFSTIIIQFAMRQCFLFTELLLEPSLPPAPQWLKAILLDETGRLQYYYFTAVVAGAILSCSILLVIRIQNRQRHVSGFLMYLFTLLVIIQILFLPVNYGILVFDKWTPKVQALGDEHALSACEKCDQECQEAWLVWEGKDGMTYLVRTWKRLPDSQSLNTPSLAEKRVMTTIPHKNINKTEIISYDFIPAKLFTEKECKK